MFYDYQKLMSYNSLLNFIIGERGVGKSYGAKKYVIKRFLKTGEQFVYIRRYKTELRSATMKSTMGTFFNQIENDEELQGHTYSNTKDTCFIDKKPCGYLIPLSTANILKSASFDKVKTIIFDEFIIDKGCYHYLNDEVEQFLDIIETIGRLRDVRVLFLGNAITITNPYFMYFNLTLPYNSEFKICKKDSDGKPLIIINYIKNIEYRETKKATRFGQLIQDTKYGSYAIDNQFLRDNKSFIRKKTENSKFYYTLYLNGDKIGLWYDNQEKLLFASDDVDPKCPTVYTLNTGDHDENTILLSGKTNSLIKSLLEYYRNGRLCFENQVVKNQLMDFIERHIGF